MDKKAFVYDYILNSGILLLNQNSQYDSLMEIQGDWDTIMTLIEKRKVYFSKVFYDMTTYISDEMYPYFKFLKKDIKLGHNEEKIYNFLNQYGGQDTELLKTVLGLDKKSFDTSINQMLKNMQVTVLDRGKTLNKQWSTYIWGTMEQWEQGANISNKIISEEEAYNKIFGKLQSRLSEKKISSMLK
ncbi:MAG: hypothetical protein K0R92_648 [Lachnospiraceae bacterium]|jgi:hypothetical protein|nr:hypothetical protein [Lachnospiraceae bacterium]